LPLLLLLSTPLPLLLLLAAQTVTSSKATTMMKGALTITATMLMQDERGRWLPPLHTSQQLPFPNLIFFYCSLLLLYIVNDPTLTDKNLGWRINVNKQNTASMATKFSIMRCQQDTKVIKS